MTDPGSSFDGRLVERGSPAYEAARVDAIFNERRPGRFPAAVLEAETEADVVAGVRLARNRGWRVGIRSGGHSWAAWSLLDDALLIDLAGLRELSVDEQRGVARVSPSIRGGSELNPYLRERGYLFPGGHCSTVGLGGYLLQGGQGWNSRTWGWGCENVVGVDVVTADGELVHASQDSHADLYWAARGSGPGFFGAVTRFHLKLHDLPPVFVHTTYVLPMGVFDELMPWAHELLPTLDTRVEPVIVGTRIAPPGLEHDGAPLIVLHATGMFDTIDEARRLMAPLATCPALAHALVREQCQPTSFDIENPIMDGQNPTGHRYAADCAWTDASAAELAPVLGDIYRTLPTPETFVIWYGWAPKRPLPDMAFSMEANVYIAAYTIWRDPAQDAAMMQWVTDRFQALEPVSKGSYLGDADQLRRPSPFMADTNFAKLEALRRVYDRDGRFPGFLTKPDATPNAFEPRS